MDETLTEDTPSQPPAKHSSHIKGRTERMARPVQLHCSPRCVTRPNCHSVHVNRVTDGFDCDIAGEMQPLHA